MRAAMFSHLSHFPISAYRSVFPHGTLRKRRPAWCFGLLLLPPPHALLPSASHPGLAPCSAHVRWKPMTHRPAWVVLHLPPRVHFRARSMITSVLPVRATGQSIHARTLITSVLPVRAIGQSIHARTMIASVLFPVRAIGQSIHARTMITSVYQSVRLARASMPAR